MNLSGRYRRPARRALAALLGLLAASALSAETPARNFAQSLVDQTLAKHRELTHLVMHVTPPGKPDTDNVIIASSMGRIGKAADEDDLRIMRTGTPEGVVTKSGDGFNVSLPLLDTSGRTIGLLAVGYPYRPGDDQAALNARAAELRNALRRQIPSAARLFSP